VYTLRIIVMKFSLLIFLLIASPLALSGPLEEAIAGDHRVDKNTARDVDRHPFETLSFFGVEPTHTVVEISPGGSGWYTAILAPLVREKGKLYAAHYDPEATYKYFQNSLSAFKTKMAGNPEVYNKVELTVMQPPTKLEIAPDQSADRILTFRNVHNWLKNGGADEAMKAFYIALKPGGILGIVDHRAKPGTGLEEMNESGYLTEEITVALAEAAGFKLLAKSEVNANPKDSADYPKGVWTLPPSLRLGDKNRAEYLAIGESDRMTLKFVKPII
jgi:predicted methyltransferase